jgi:predicted nucleotidyltransferase component of viral defense system
VIPANEIHSLSMTQGVPLPHVEKDYVMGWLLWGIAGIPDLRQSLVLKGGNCLRKVYFPDTRFSDDLDFTTVQALSGVQLREQLVTVLEVVEGASGIQFVADRMRVEEVQTPDPDEQAIDARVYFRGFAGDASLVFRIKFDVSPYERVVLPIQERNLIHGYSDSGVCHASLRSYALEEVLAEKLRSWIQRTRARDLFDVAKIITSGQVDVRKRDILRVFLEKTLFKGVPSVAREELLADDKFTTITSHWLASIVCPLGAIILVENAIMLFKGFVNALFQPDMLPARYAGHFCSGSPLSCHGCYYPYPLQHSRSAYLGWSRPSLTQPYLLRTYSHCRTLRFEVQGPQRRHRC